ncbi:calmodulin-regulated spectrin-associated protein 2a [Centroberyx affinis]|uniref:calmodulin-regulated spectrin-associated protein 2a n=1 Tax=Centroberyx affinis TaxID=166261 RepID=UPI003A5BE492
MGEVQDVRDFKKTFVAPAIKSFDHYDFSRAKICCSLTWLVAKAYGTDSVPADLRDPFYTDQYEQEHLKPPVTSLLLSADLYCRAGSLILKSDAAKPLLGHDAVIQALAQRGLYITDQERLVTERDLRKRPLQMSAHLAMIDTLMMAYTVETVSVEKVMACIRQYSPHDPEVETPYDTEDAVTTWINKVNEYLKDVVAQEQRKKETQSAEPAGSPRSPTKWYMKLVPARYRKDQASTQPAPWIPPVDNLLKDSSDGSALTALLHFYCPQLLPLDDVCLKENMSLADSLYNLQLIQDFCKDNLSSCCHFSLEDMLYASSTVKNNYLVFMAELFWWFEVVKPSFVKPRTLENEGTDPLSLLKNMPAVPISKATKRSFMERPPSPERPSLPLRPQPRNSGEIKRSTSMSFVDGNLGTWPKEKRSGPYGVSFDIPFDKEDSASGAPSSTRGMIRSVSTDDGSGFKVHHLPRGMKRNLSFQPVNGQSVGIEEEGCPDSLAGMEPDTRPTGRTYPNGHGNVIPPPPSMEEALQIIHSPSRPPVEGINNGFFLHSQDRGPGGVGGLEPVSESDSKGPLSTTDTTEVDTGIHIRTEDMLDEDSSLKDCSMNMELDMDTPSPCPSSHSKSLSGVKMTSFAEQKLRKLNPPAPDSGRGSSSSLKTTPEGSELGLPLSVSWAPTPEHSPIHQQTTPTPTTQTPPTPVPLPPNDPAQAMATEMVQLRMRLEEKRKAIEAQKKKVEAAFTRHRQRMGRSAFLTVVKRKGDGAASGAEEEGRKMEEEGKAGSTSPTFRSGRSKADTPDGAEQGSTGSRWLKSPGGGEESGPSTPQPTEVDLAEYTRSIEKLNHSLAFLQTEMQRLAQQQEVIMAMREQQHQQAWVIPPPPPSPQKHGRAGAVTRSSGPSSPADSPRSTHRSPTSIKRKSASFHSRNPRTPRPSELKLAPYNRVLTAPQSVDSIPRLRRFSPCQPLASSFVYMGEKPATANPETVAPDGDKSKEGHSLLFPERELASVNIANSELDTHAKTQEMDTHGQSGISEMETDEKSVADIKPTVDSSVSEVLSQPVKETFTVTPTESPPQLGASGQTKSSLIEVPLSVLKPLEGISLEDAGEMQQEEGLDDDQKMCRGFFFKEEGKGVGDMAQKRAALLEKRMRREKESQQRKMQLEAELEQKKEEARLKAEEERLRKEEDKARREFIKQEYLRRKQLKLMEDMDTVIKPRPPSAARQRRGRPKSIHRDSMDSPKTPVRAATGSRQRVFSVSSLSLASLNLGDSDSVHSEKRAPRSASLASGSLLYFLSSPKLRRRRPDSADGFLSPSRSSSRNGEKDWENGSTTSSVTSNTEYTGPKLYKEPSAKSNKHIIQNALAHCCLAGKVNEGQKNKILEEMEKSEANNFLVLFRDAGCQFRSLYTYCPESEEINKLAGIGPKSITRKMIDGLYKYYSDKKQFSQIPAKTMSASVDAVTIHSHLWQTKKPATPKKVLPAQC